MRVRWFGQSSFLLEADYAVFIDPFGDMSSVIARGRQFDYPAIDGVEADVVLVTHEHVDHNGIEVVGGSPVVVRSQAGRFDSPIGEIVGVASEHDDVAGTARGSNTIYCFTLERVRFCHFGDFGQPALRPEQRQAIGPIDVLFMPVGGGATVGSDAAADIVRSLEPRVVFPMHYRTAALNFLEPPDAFLDALGTRVERTKESVVSLDVLLDAGSQPPLIALLAPPLS